MSGSRLRPIGSIRHPAFQEDERPLSVHEPWPQMPPFSRLHAANNFFQNSTRAPLQILLKLIDYSTDDSASRSRHVLVSCKILGLAQTGPEGREDRMLAPFW